MVKIISFQIMKNTERIIILKEFRRLLWVITFYNRENFYGTNRGKFWRNIAATFLFTFCFVMLVLVLLGGILYCYDRKFDVKESATAAPIAISIAQIVLMYPSLAFNNRKVSKMIKNLQAAVDKRVNRCPIFISY